MKLGSFDKDQIKRFFVLNVEKMVFGLSMIGVAILCYSAIQKVPYDKVPQDVESGISRARDNITKGVLNKERDGIVTPVYEAMARRAGEAVPQMDFIDRPWWADDTRKVGSKRKDPAFLAVRELVGTSGTAPFAMIDPYAGLRGQTVAQGEGPGRSPSPVATPPGPKRPTAAAGKGKTGIGNLVFGGGGEGGGEAAPQVAPGPGVEGLGGAGISNEPRGVSAPADSLVKGQQWVCITGLVPFKEQLKKYTEEFEKAAYIDPLLDTPDYAGYFVERAEVPEGASGDPAKLKWTALQVQAALAAAQKEWAVVATEVVDPNLTHPSLTFPLGPILGRNWEKDVAHPKIPVLDAAQRAGGVDPNQTRPAVGTEEPPKDDADAFSKKERTAAGGPGGAAQPGGPRQTYGPSRGYGGEGRGVPMPRGVQMGGEGGFGGVAQGTQDLTPEHLLFRFFDFTVQEGKRYRYRVKLVLWNPNKNVRAKFLTDAKLATENVKYSDWSQPSPIISVTTYNTILAGPVKAADKAYEARANVVVVQLDKQLGVKAIDECREARKKPGQKPEEKAMEMLSRGQLLNYTANVDVFHPLTHRVEKRDIYFNPGLVLLDLRGGEPLTPNPRDKDKMPGEILFLDANGWLMVKSELEDEASYKAEVSILDRMEAAASGTQAYPGGGEGVLPPGGRRRGGEGGR